MPEPRSGFVMVTLLMVLVEAVSLMLIFMNVTVEPGDMYVTVSTTMPAPENTISLLVSAGL